MAEPLFTPLCWCWCLARPNGPSRIAGASSLVGRCPFSERQRLEALTRILVLGLLAAHKLQDRRSWLVIREVKLELHASGDLNLHRRLNFPREAAAALAAPEQTGADTEWLGTGGVMNKVATLHCTDHEIARTTRDGPRLGWQRHLAALPRS
jgi:hypothetical protein